MKYLMQNNGVSQCIFASPGPLFRQSPPASRMQELAVIVPPQDPALIQG